MSIQPPKVEKRPAGMSDHEYVELYRRQAPVAIDRYGFYWVFSHANMLTVTDPALTRQAETEKLQVLGISDGPIWEYFANSLLFSNGDAHERRRRPLARAFAYRVMDGLRPRIRSIAEGLIRPHLGAETDVLNDIAGPLPARIVAAVLGAPEADIPYFSSLVYPAMRALSLRHSEDIETAATSLSALDDYIVELLKNRRATPQDDFLSAYVKQVDEAGLTAEETRVQISSVILAGSDTTRMALCSTLAQLWRHPDQWAAFVADPEGLKADVAAEGLRFDPVIGSLPRIAVTDFDLEGVSIPKAAVLVPIIPAVLRDPEVYADADTFNIHRKDHPRYHPVFGAGAHRCLGEALARAELEEALAAFASLAPNAELITAPKLSGVAGARSIDGMTARL